MTGERESQPKEWLIARCFSDERAALRAWRMVRRTMLQDDLDVSVLRFLLEGRSHVAVLGEGPLPAESERTIANAIEPNSELVELPPAIAQTLRERRREFKQTGLGYLQMRGNTTGGPTS